MIPARRLASLAAPSRLCISLRTRTWLHHHSHLATQDAAASQHAAAHASRSGGACCGPPKPTPEVDYTPRSSGTWGRATAAGAKATGESGASDRSSWCRRYLTVRSPSASQASQVSRAASSGAGAAAAGAGASQESCGGDRSGGQARVQQQWDAALAHAVGAEAVAAGDAALRELLQVCGEVGYGTVDTKA